MKCSTRIKPGYKLKQYALSGVVSSLLFEIELKMTESPAFSVRLQESTGSEPTISPKKVNGSGIINRQWYTIGLILNQLGITIVAQFQTGELGPMITAKITSLSSARNSN
jgi:hypothetical protein